MTYEKEQRLQYRSSSHEPWVAAKVLAGPFMAAADDNSLRYVIQADDEDGQRWVRPEQLRRTLPRKGDKGKFSTSGNTLWELRYLDDEFVLVIGAEPTACYADGTPRNMSFTRNWFDRCWEPSQ